MQIILREKGSTWMYQQIIEIKLIGGIAKGHPNDRDLERAVAFFKRLE